MRQKLGQHFLVNQEISKAIAAAIEPAAGDTIIEVGPGHGELTQNIVAAIQSGDLKNVKIVAVEKDPLLAEEMRERFKEYSFVEVIEADILKFLSDDGASIDPENASRFSPPANYKLIGNLPYYLTGYLLRMISELGNKPALSVFMVQKEVAERMAAKPPQMNRLAAAVQFWAEPKILFYVSKNEFDPPPEVDSAVIVLNSHQRGGERKNAAAFYRTVRDLFAQPRKTVFNNLRKTFNAKKLSEEESLRLLKDADINPKARPQDLSLEKISNLADRMGGI